MPIRVNTRELLEILAHTPPAQNVLLVGRHGIGKSEIIAGFYAGRGLRVVPLFLGQMSDPGDLLGLPHKAEEGDRTVFLPPYWWPVADEPVALFLDELNRARPEILQAVHDLALNRTLAGRRLPAGSVVVSAINAGEEYQVTDLDPALASRFNVYEFAPEADEWLAWAHGRKLDPRVLTFLEQHSSFLDAPAGDAAQDPLDKTPDRRAWTRVAELLAPHQQLSPALHKAVAGIVGAQAALALVRSQSERAAVTPEDLLLHPSEKVDQALRGLAVPDLAALNRQVLYYIQEHLARFTAAQRKKVPASVERYLERLREDRRTEALADFINQTEQPHFAQASALLLASPKILQALTSYMERVKL